MCLALRVLRMQIGYPADLSCASRSCALWVFDEGFPKGLPAPAENARHPCRPLSGYLVKYPQGTRAAMLGPV